MTIRYLKLAITQINTELIAIIYLYLYKSYFSRSSKGPNICTYMHGYYEIYFITHVSLCCLCRKNC